MWIICGVSGSHLEHSYIRAQGYCFDLKKYFPETASLSTFTSNTGKRGKRRKGKLTQRHLIHDPKDNNKQNIVTCTQ